MLVKKGGINNGLVVLNKTKQEIKDWINQIKDKGYNKFLVEEFHQVKHEFYVSFRS